MTDDEEEEQVGWTIYYHPPAYPAHYAVQQWWVGEAGEVVPYSFAALCESLEEAREQIPAGCLRFERDPDDDPSIVETWM